ncbi:MAG: hypothetical protein HQL97_01750 [Magnetococcales bacterium]|nr:hypothetical protein [Magnetococcales bacterium]
MSQDSVENRVVEEPRPLGVLTDALNPDITGLTCAEVPGSQSEPSVCKRALGKALWEIRQRAINQGMMVLNVNEMLSEFRRDMSRWRKPSAQRIREMRDEGL